MGDMTPPGGTESHGCQRHYPWGCRQVTWAPPKQPRAQWKTAPLVLPGTCRSYVPNVFFKNRDYPRGAPPATWTLGPLEPWALPYSRTYGAPVYFLRAMLPIGAGLWPFPVAPPAVLPPGKRRRCDPVGSHNGKKNSWSAVGAVMSYMPRAWRPPGSPPFGEVPVRAEGEAGVLSEPSFQVPAESPPQSFRNP